MAGNVQQLGNRTDLRCRQYFETAGRAPCIVHPVHATTDTHVQHFVRGDLVSKGEPTKALVTGAQGTTAIAASGGVVPEFPL